MAKEEDDEDGAAAALSSSPNDSGGSFPLDLSAHGHMEAATQAGGERSTSRASDDDEGASAPKKLRLSKDQSAFLEESFKEHITLNPVSIRPSVHEKLELRSRSCRKLGPDVDA
jgi:homeobox-leucine zipper protein